MLSARREVMGPMTADWIGVLVVAFLLLVVTLYSLQVAFRGARRRGSPSAGETVERPPAGEQRAESGGEILDESDLPKAA